jgi:ribosomal protein S20
MNKLHATAYLTLSTIIVLLSFKSCEKTNPIIVHDTLTKVIEDNGTETSKIKTIIAKYEDAIRVKDLEILKLSKHTESSTIIKYVYKDTGSTKTIVLWMPNDTMPTYRAEFCDTNICGTIIATKDSIKRDFKVYNHILLKQEWQRAKWYKRRELFTQVSNSNPYVTTIEMKSYIKQPKSRKWVYVTSAVVGFALGVWVSHI